MKLRKSLSLASILLLLLGVANGCSPSLKNAPASTAATATQQFTDSAGRTVTLPAQLTRVAPSGPLAQMILYTVAPDRMTGWSIRPGDGSKPYITEKYWDLPEFGQFYGKNATLNLEALIAAKPQVIIDIGEVKKSIAADMDGIQAQTGIPTVFIEATLDTMPATYRTLGKLLGMDDTAESQAQYIENTLADATAKAALIPAADRLGVFYGTGSSGLDANAKGSIHADVLDFVGANNVTVVKEVSGKGGGNPISMEQLLNFAPDVILFTADGPYQTVNSDPRWSGLAAIQQGHYYEIPNEPYNWLGSPPSVNRILGIKWLGNLLYPQVFNYNMVTEAQTFYKIFYHYDLSTTQAESLLSRSTLK